MLREGIIMLWILPLLSLTGTYQSAADMGHKWQKVQHELPLNWQACYVPLPIVLPVIYTEQLSSQSRCSEPVASVRDCSLCTG